MRIDILTACPELLDSPLNHSIVQRAKDKGLVEIYVHNLRDFTLDKHRKIDDYAFGFGAGMVLQVEPIDLAISYLTSQRQYDEIIFTAPDGERFTQKEANALSLKENIIILATKEKILKLRGQPLLVDTGDVELDEQLSGYHHVICDYNETIVCKVCPG